MRCDTQQKACTAEGMFLGNEVEHDEYSWGDWTSEKRSSQDAKRADRNAQKAAHSARKLRSQLRKRQEEQLSAAKSKALSAFTKATDAVQGRGSDLSPLQQPEFKDYVKKTEKMVEVREQTAKESETKAHLRKVQHTGSAHAVPKEVHPKRLPDATTFSHTLIYQDKVADGNRVINQAKELTAKVSKQERQKGTKVKQSAQQSANTAQAFQEHKWPSQPTADSYKWYTPPKSTINSAGVEFEQQHWNRAKDQYNDAMEKIKKQQRNVVKTTIAGEHTNKMEQGESNPSWSLGDSGMDAEEPTQTAFAEAKRLLQAKLETISERRVKAASSESSGVVPVQTQIDNAVHKAYDAAYQQANKRADETIRKIKDTAKEEVRSMKKQVEAKMESEQRVMERNARKVHKLENDSAAVAKASADKVEKVIDGKAKKEERKYISKVEDTLAANQAIKQAKSKLKRASKEAFEQALEAAKVAHNGGSATEQSLSDARASSLKHKVVFLRNQLKLTEKMVTSAPESPNAGMKATKMNAKQDMARAQAKVQISEAKCEDAKAKVKTQCAAPTNATNSTSPEDQVVFLDMQGPKEEEKKLDKQLKKLDGRINATDSEKSAVRKSISQAKTCATAKGNVERFCGKVKDSERAEYDERIRAAGQIAVAAKYKAARVASLQAQGQATKEDLVKQDAEATKLELKYRKLKNIPFRSTTVKGKPKLKLKPAEASLIKKLVEQQVSTALENSQAQPASSSSVSLTDKEKKTEKKLQRKEGRAMIQQEKDKSKLRKQKSEAKAETNKSKKLIGEAAAQLKQAQQGKNETKIEAAQENLSSMKRTGMKMDLLEKEKTKEVKDKSTGAKVQVKKLKKKVAVQEKMVASQRDVKAAKLKATTAELYAAKDAAKAKHRAYKAAMKAAKVASRAAMQHGPAYYTAKKEVYAADKSARLAGKASKFAVDSAQDVYQCNAGKVEQMKLAAKVVKAKAAYKTFLTKQKEQLDKTTNKVCEKATKLANKKERAKKAAQKEKEEANKEIKKEIKKEKKEEYPVRRQWDIVRQDGTLTAKIHGMNVTASAATVAPPTAANNQSSAINVTASVAASSTTANTQSSKIARAQPQDIVSPLDDAPAQPVKSNSPSPRAIKVTCHKCKARCKSATCNRWCEQNHCGHSPVPSPREIARQVAQTSPQQAVAATKAAVYVLKAAQAPGTQ